MTEIERLWNDYMAMGFPKGAAVEEIDGIDLVETDTFAAGCISAFLGNKGTLDTDRVNVLRKCVSDLERLLPGLNGEVSSYFGHLYQVGCLVLREARIR